MEAGACVPVLPGREWCSSAFVLGADESPWRVCGCSGLMFPAVLSAPAPLPSGRLSCGGLPESSEGGLIIALQGNLSNDSLPSECSWEVAVASLMCSFPRPYAWGVTCP